MLSTLSKASFRRSFAVYIWGNGSDGFFGVGKQPQKFLQPEKVLGIDELDVKQVSCGMKASAFITKEGDLYTWGNGSKFCLGHGDETNREYPSKVTGLDGKVVKKVECGESHMAALTQDGEVYTWGFGGKWWSGCGGLGHGSTKSVEAPKLVSDLSEDKFIIEDIGCGDMHTLALSTDGDVFVWGRGEFGRLGTGSSADQKSPVLVDFFLEFPVKKISVGAAFNMAITDQDILYSWGRNDQSQLGLGGSMSMDVLALENMPKRIEALDGKDVVSLGAGPGYACAVLENGSLYHWGSRQWLEPTLLTVENDEAVEFASVACGAGFALAVSKEGQLYSIGKGKHGVLGTGTKKHSTALQKVEGVEGKILSVACGHSHVLVATDAK